MNRRRAVKASSRPPQSKTFSLHWGSGVIEEGVHYDLRVRFQRSALIIDPGEMRRLGQALRKAPKLRRLVAGLTG